MFGVQFYLLELFHKGGPMMWPLLFISIVGVAFVIERAIHYKRNSINIKAFSGRIKESIDAGKIQQAQEICDEPTSKGPIPVIVKTGLMKYNEGRRAVERVIEQVSGTQMSRLEGNLIWLATVANVAPMIGFLGTVSGMIKSFDVIAKQGLNNPALVALGISEALITTATGLAIAVPIQFFYNAFVNHVNKLTIEMEEIANMIIDRTPDVE